VETTEKPRGPSYLRFGLKLFSDFKGDGRFSLLAFYNKTWINSLGAEWRTLAQLGGVFLVR
jgi:NTE family protein